MALSIKLVFVVALILIETYLLSIEFFRDLYLLFQYSDI